MPVNHHHPFCAPARPDPDALVAQLQAAQQQAQRGKLRIYFGSNAGVGKTYAMLAAAQRERQAGMDVLVGLVETHDRAETVQQLHGLKQLPRRSVSYQGETRTPVVFCWGAGPRPGVVVFL